jgi:hypothetical protein
MDTISATTSLSQYKCTIEMFTHVDWLLCDLYVGLIKYSLWLESSLLKLMFF